MRACLRAASFAPLDLIFANYDIAEIKTAGYQAVDFTIDFDWNLGALTTQDVADLVSSLFTTAISHVMLILYVLRHVVMCLAGIECRR